MAGTGYQNAAPGSTPMIMPGPNNLQISVSVFNMGTVGGNIAVTIENASTSAVLNAQNLNVAAQGNAATALAAITMPATALSLLISATP